MSNAPKARPTSTAEYADAVAHANQYEDRMDYWRQALIELEPQKVVTILKSVHSLTTTLSHAEDAFYAAASACKELVPVQRISAIIALLLMENMQFEAQQLAEILSKHRMSTAFAAIPRKALAETKAQVEDLLSGVPGFDQEKDREYARKHVAVLLRSPSKVAQHIARLPASALDTLDSIANPIGGSLEDYRLLPDQSLPIILEYVSPQTPRERRDVLKDILRQQLELGLSA